MRTSHAICPFQNHQVLRSKEIRINSEDISTLLNVFKYFQDRKGTADKRLTLQEWATEQSAQISEREACKRLTAFVSAAQTADSLKGLSFDSGRLIELLQKAPTKLEQDTEQALRDSIVTVLEKALVEVGGELKKR